MRRSPFAPLLLALLAAPPAHAQPGCLRPQSPEAGPLRPYLHEPTWTSTYIGGPPDVRRYEDFHDDVPTTEDESPRWFAGGGIVLPLATPLGYYDIGGGASLGIEFPQSEYHGYVVRLDYDHMNEGGLFGSDDHGGADIGTLRAGVRVARHRRGPISEFTEAAFGLGVAAFSSRHPDYGTPYPFAEAHESQRGAGPMFSFGGGLELNPQGGGPGFFLESDLIFLFVGGSTVDYAPFRLGLTFPWGP